jgi:hypothetical protein
MPKNHLFKTEWGPKRFLSWAREIAPEVEELISKIIDSRPHPEQAFKTCMGLLHLHKKCDNNDYIKACKKALALDCLTYKFIKNAIEAKTFNLDTEQELDLFKLPEHENIRGKDHYN